MNQFTMLTPQLRARIIAYAVANSSETNVEIAKRFGTTSRIVRNALLVDAA